MPSNKGFKLIWETLAWKKDSNNVPLDFSLDPALSLIYLNDGSEERRGLYQIFRWHEVGILANVVDSPWRWPSLIPSLPGSGDSDIKSWRIFSSSWIWAGLSDSFDQQNVLKWHSRISDTMSSAALWLLPGSFGSFVLGTFFSLRTQLPGCNKPKVSDEATRRYLGQQPQLNS